MSPKFLAEYASKDNCHGHDYNGHCDNMTDIDGHILAWRNCRLSIKPSRRYYKKNSHTHEHLLYTPKLRIHPLIYRALF